MKNKVTYIGIAVLFVATSFYMLHQDNKLLEYEAENDYLKWQIESNENLIKQQKETLDKLEGMLYNENMAEKEAIANTIKDTSHGVVEKKVVEITHYTHTGNPTASGAYPVAGRTVACNFLPLGTKVRIDGHTYIVQDRGGMAGNVIDVFVDTQEEAIQKGRQYKTVEVK